LPLLVRRYSDNNDWLLNGIQTSENGGPKAADREVHGYGVGAVTVRADQPSSCEAIQGMETRAMAAATI
jgi:hypothetical protein